MYANTNPDGSVDIYLKDENGNPTEQRIAVHWSADQLAVEEVLEAELDDDGRSGWRWFVLQNGSRILGVFPHGGTYESTEWDYPGYQNSRRDYV